ncbi:hypothetical protein H0H81_008606 [Sphagnurus paluster]|uniref:Uncharacterized protein n=1 Tax=Sphagnurus paluster TaxID=117069 RepID=A0A9P7KIA6_9AGAR|nr:hypothetical protein H0H81_008606 [Sphagnurus paluster]
MLVKEHLGQLWLLLSASLADVVPVISPPPAKSPSQEESQTITHSTSAPAAIPSSYAFPSTANTPSQLRKTSPSHASIVGPRSASTSASRKMTPASSNSSSPRQITNMPLPSIMAPRRPSVFSIRENADSDFSRRSSISHYQRPSITAHGHSLSPADKGSLRHVGEGALDDSDSSSASGSDGGNEVNNHEGFSDDESGLQPLISPNLLLSRGVPTPSPLSRVAGKQRWTEDEGEEREEEDADESSPSPGSTDTDSPDPNYPPRRKVLKNPPRGLKRQLSKKSRSRSSTVASLAAPTLPLQSLVRQDSHSSIRTVIAGEVSFPVPEVGVKAEDTLRNIRTHDRHKLMPTSELALEPLTSADAEDRRELHPEDLTDRRIEMVTADERRLRELSWMALREALERFADEVGIRNYNMQWSANHSFDRG